MTPRQQLILDTLRTRSTSTFQLALTIGQKEHVGLIPEASVRRDIQGLRQAGYDILYVRGFATLVAPEYPDSRTHNTGVGTTVAF